MPTFIPGLELSRHFYFEAVRPVLDARFPGLPHAAVHIGAGSDVLGFDTEMSTDHGWGPTVRIFLRDEDESLAAPIRDALRHELPHVFYGYAVDVAESEDDPGTPVMREKQSGPVEHRVYPTTLRGFIREELDFDLEQEIEPADWLTFPAQVLRGLTAGAVHHDGVGELSDLRRRLAYYPRDVWLYMLAAGWQRIAQEEHLMPRAGYVGDELGSALIGSRLVRDLMALCFLMERVYPTYPKWFGTAFRQLACAADLWPVLRRAQLAAGWQKREAALAELYEHLARMHNALALTAPLPETASSFFNRPFKVIWGGRFADALLARIADPAVKRIASRPPIGSIDQFSDSTDLRSDIRWRQALRRLYL